MRIATFVLILLSLFVTVELDAQQRVARKPRILGSTDIGGTAPDDNQSMAHLLMYSDLVTIEGLVSSPSYGNGSKQEIERMIDLYEKDLPALKRHREEFAEPDYLRSVTKQGRRGGAPWAGYTEATEGSEWIVECARRPSERPLWILVWGGLEDVAQALHDAPDIAERIWIYWIGGPNKKWSVNSYAYIAANFPSLRFIEVNSSYYGFFSKTGTRDTVAFCTVIEFVFQGPEIDIPADSVCFWMETPYKKSVQRWAGYYLGEGRYRVRYAPKQAETVNYSFSSEVPGLLIPKGAITVDNLWPGKRHSTDYPLSEGWYTDKGDPELYDGNIQGGKTVSKWRRSALEDWAERWGWLK